MAWFAAIWLLLLSYVASSQEAVGPRGAEECAMAEECAPGGSEDNALLQLKLADDAAARGAQRSDVGEDMMAEQKADEGANECIYFHVPFPGYYKGAFLSHVLVRFVNVEYTTFSVPRLTLPSGGHRPLDKQYDGYETPTMGNYLFGQASDTIYYEAGDHFQLEKSTSNWAVTGVFPNAAYTSVELSYGPNRDTARLVFEGRSYGSYFADRSAAPNPYITGNPTVLTYGAQARCASSWATSFTQVDFGGNATTAGEEAPAEQFSKGSCTETNTKVFRLPKDLSLKIADGGNTTGGCSYTYLFSPGVWAGRMYAVQYRSYVPISKSYSFAYGFIKMKLPHVFNNFEDRVFQGPTYQTLVFDVSSNYFIPPAPNVPFTVTTPMMQADGFHTPDQFGYVLFAPLDQVRRMQTDWKTPPVVEIPGLNVKAYLINAPDFLFVFRYRGPRTTWQGSTYNAPCADDAISGLSMPATCEDLGDYLPQITRVDGVHSVDGLVSRIR